MVGRSLELEVFEQAWTAVLGGERQAVFVGGEPGAGKTRLAAEVAGVLHAHDTTVLVGTSVADFAVPYHPFAEMLDHLFVSIEQGGLAETIGNGGAELSRLAPSVARHIDGDTRSPTGDGGARHRLFEAVAQLVRSLAGERPLVLVFEDLHWARAPALALLSFVLDTVTDVPLLAVGTFRTTEPDRSSALTEHIADLYRLEGIRRIDLSGLDTEEIAEYLHIHAAVSLGDARAPAALLRDQTGGNPFFLREVWRDLEQRGGLEALRGGPDRVPVSVGDTLDRRLAGLGDNLREVLDLAAVVGDTFDLVTLVAASDAERSTSLAGIDAAIALNLIDGSTDRPGEYSFIHSLTRRAVLDRLAPSRAAQLHARVARALESRGDEPLMVPRLANHYLAATVLGFDREAVRYATEAGRLAERSLAFEEAAAWFERVAALPAIDAESRSRVLLSAAENHVRAGDFARGRLLYRRLAHTGTPEVRLGAAMGYEDATWRPGMADSEAADLLTAALSEGGADVDDGRRLRATASLSRALALSGEVDLARDLGTRVIDEARRLDDPETLAHALFTSLWHGGSPEMVETQLNRATELSRLATEIGDIESLGVSGYFGAGAAYLSGKPGELATAVADQRRAAAVAGQPFFSYIEACLVQARCFLSADFTAAEQWAQRAVRLGESFGAFGTDGSFGVQMFMIRRETGALDRYRPHLTGDESSSGRWLPGLLALYTELGVARGVSRTLQPLIGRDLEQQSHSALWPAELVFMVEGALLVRDHDALDRLAPLLTRALAE